MKIVADNHIPFVREYFGAYGELILKSGRLISRNDLKEADMLLVRSITHVDKKLLADTKVKFVASVTAGRDHLDTNFLDEAGIAWCNAHGFNAPPVADYIVSMLAALERKGFLLAKRNKRAAVIGVGNVGKLVVEILRFFDFDVVLCDPVRAMLEPDFVSATLDELSDLDLISIHVPLVKTGKHPTYHFIDKRFLHRQKLGCILLNASRGAVINTEELKQYGSHLHWCFDVWEHEPKIDKEVLENALLATPHIAGYSVQSKMRGTDMIYRLACDKRIIKPQSMTPIEMPHQQLAFAGLHHHWQDIVLGIFNPVIFTAMMRTALMPNNDYGHVFDEMRNHFNYRHEFSYTTVQGINVAEEDKRVLDRLGIKLV